MKHNKCQQRRRRILAVKLWQPYRVPRRTNERIETKSQTLHPLPLTDVKGTGLRYYKIMTVKLWQTHKVAWKLDKQAETRAQALHPPRLTDGEMTG
jgi:hypothetical protein